MENLGIDPTLTLIITLFVAGFVELVKYFFARAWEKVAIIMISAVAGGIAGAMLGLGPIIGVCAGFAASGVITVVKRVGDY